MPLNLPIEPPPLIEPAVSLVRSANQPLSNPSDPEMMTRWKHGVAYTPEFGVALRTSDPCAHGSAVDITGEPALGHVEWQPYNLDASVRCHTQGSAAFDFKGRVRRRLTVGTPKGVEHEFWSGSQARASGWGTNLWLAMPAVADRTVGFGPIDLTGGTPVSVKRAIEILEQALADCGLGTQGIIHLRPEALPYVPTLRRDGNLIRTLRDTLIVPGVGYPNEGPGNAATAAGTTWLYATGMVDVWLDSDFLFTPDPDNEPDWQARGMDRATNTLTVYAHRFAMATWDGQCHFAVHANIDVS